MDLDLGRSKILEELSQGKHTLLTLSLSLSPTLSPTLSLTLTPALFLSPTVSLAPTLPEPHPYPSDRGSSARTTFTSRIFPGHL